MPNNTRARSKKPVTTPSAKAASKVVAVEPIAEAVEATPASTVVTTPAPAAKVPRLDFVGGVAQIFNGDGLVTTMESGKKASSECRHRELETLRPHIAVPLGTSDEEIATMLSEREARMLDRPKIQRLMATKTS